MAVKKRGLGRGLDALLSGINEAAEAPVSVEMPASTDETDNFAADGSLRHLPLHEIERGRYQPRRDMEPQALEELANSIRAQGIMQPIVVRPQPQGGYEIIAGERRWRAAQMAGLNTIPVIIRQVADEAAIAMALIENIQRENLNPMEEAIALQRLQNEFELTQQQVAEAVGKSRSTVANLLRLMNLQEDVKRLLEYGDLEMGHARALLALEDQQQVDAAEQVVSRSLSVRETEQLVKRIQQGEVISRPKTAPMPQLKEWSGRLSRQLETPVKITSSAQGKGKISISFSSETQLLALLERLQQEQDGRLKGSDFYDLSARAE